MEGYVPLSYKEDDEESYWKETLDVLNRVVDELTVRVKKLGEEQYNVSTEGGEVGRHVGGEANEGCYNVGEQVDESEVVGHDGENGEPIDVKLEFVGHDGGENDGFSSSEGEEGVDNGSGQESGYDKGQSSDSEDDEYIHNDDDVSMDDGDNDNEYEDDDFDDKMG